MELLLVTGMSGAGKTLALQTLEDIGYFCVDNLPPQLLLYLLDEKTEAAMSRQRMAVTVDIRCEALLPGMEALLKGLSKEGTKTNILFLDADDTELQHRYKETRRLHPLVLKGEASDLSEAIRMERDKLSGLRQLADTVLNTSRWNMAQLRQKIADRYAADGDRGFTLEFVAFGFKYGILADADLVFDVRCLPNPYYIQELRALTGEDRAVQDYIFASEEAVCLFEKIRDYLEYSVPLYEKEGKMNLVIGFGCTGGQHRSLAFAVRMRDYFAARYPHVKLSSRDAKENRFELASRLQVPGEIKKHEK